MNEPIIDTVKDVLGVTLGIEDRVAGMDAATPLFGELPELDSMAVVELATALEDRFDITIDDEDFTGETFETVGSLAAAVGARLAGRPQREPASNGV